MYRGLRHPFFRLGLIALALGLFLVSLSRRVSEDRAPQAAAGVEQARLRGAADRMAPPRVRRVVVRAPRRVPPLEAEGQAIPSERIIALREPGDIDALAARLGAHVIGRMDAARVYRLRFADESAARLALQRLDAGDVEVYPNHRIPRPEGPTWMGQLAHRPFRPVAAADTDTPIVIGLLDSAVSRDGTERDAFLLDPASPGPAAFDAPAAGPGPFHGDAVAAAILEGLSLAVGEGAASRVRILPIDVFGNGEETTSYRIAEGILHALEGGAHVINMSFGGEFPDRLVEEMVRSAYGMGIVFVAAAGNEGVADPRYPAAIPEVVAATAADDGQGDGIAPNANFGAFVDVAAPGSVVFAQGDSWYLSTGTSMSAGFVSGAIAGLSETLGIPVADAEEAVRRVLAVPGRGE